MIVVCKNREGDGPDQDRYTLLDSCWPTKREQNLVGDESCNEEEVQPLEDIHDRRVTTDPQFLELGLT